MKHSDPYITQLIAQNPIWSLALSSEDSYAEWLNALGDVKTLQKIPNIQMTGYTKKPV